MLRYAAKSISSLVRKDLIGRRALFFSTHEPHDDDEFVFPVQIIEKDIPYFKWSSAEVSRVIDLDASLFGKKKVIVSTENLKVCLYGDCYVILNTFLNHICVT